uniref:Uncharacterized protein n=1 Tax=Rhizophora mucronata TaxID=61149 RepID=A0A2P2NCM6_RHIMU
MDMFLLASLLWIWLVLLHPCKFNYRISLQNLVHR